MAVDRDRALAAKQRLRDMLGDDAALRGIGISLVDQGYAVRVNVVDEEAVVRLGLPAEVDGVPVDVKVVGTIRAL
jgi:hypothetical protein